MTIFSLSHISLARNGAAILDDVSFSARAGEHWAVLGPNGSGKTTLLTILTGYLWPMEGTVEVLGGRYGEIDIREKRKKIGLVSSALFERLPADATFRDIVLSGRFASLGLFEDISAHDRDRALELVDRLGCASIADRRYGVLSFGERQRALIGRALMADPKILIVDEPCEGLDLNARETVLGAIEHLTRDPALTVVMVTHRVEEIPPGITHALILKEGRVLASGPKMETITSETLSAAMDLPVEVLSRGGRLYAVVG